MNRKAIGPILLVVGFVVSSVGCTNSDQQLLDASRTGTLQDVKHWLSMGANVNAREFGGVAGSTALHEAAGRGSEEMVALLIAEGADVNAADDRGHTPLFRAGNKETLSLLLEAGADIKAQSKDSETVIDWADAKGFDWKSQMLREHAAKTGSES